MSPKRNNCVFIGCNKKASMKILDGMFKYCKKHFEEVKRMYLWELGKNERT
ncbi:MAG: hypothetical protein QW633_03835 [Candidatus Aenigmatarchaeota archaeon]